MALENIYTYALAGTPITRVNLHHEKYLPVKHDCLVLPGLWSNDLTEVWNCNLQGNDHPYFNPLEPGDIIYLQFQFADVFNSAGAFTHGWFTGAGDWLIKAEIIDGDEVVILNSADDMGDHFVGKGPDDFYFQQIAIEYDNILAEEVLGNSCFYIRITVKTDTGGGTMQMVSEPFGANYCDLPTVLMEGAFAVRDGINQYYKEGEEGIGTNYAHRALWRVAAFMELDGYQTTKETNEKGLVISATQFAMYSITAHGWPPYVAEIVGNLLGGQRFYADALELEAVESATKDNAESRNWYGTFTGKRRTEIRDIGCLE